MATPNRHLADIALWLSGATFGLGVGMLIDGIALGAMMFVASASALMVASANRRLQ